MIQVWADINIGNNFNGFETFPKISINQRQSQYLILKNFPKLSWIFEILFPAKKYIDSFEKIIITMATILVTD